METCALCGRDFKSRAGLRGHEQLVHSGERTISAPVETVPPASVETAAPASVAREDDQPAASGLPERELEGFRETFAMIAKAHQQTARLLVNPGNTTNNLNRRVDAIEAEPAAPLSQTASAESANAHPIGPCDVKHCKVCRPFRLAVGAKLFAAGNEASAWKGEPETAERYSANFNEWIAADKPAP